jgi:hypothetical protein
MQSRRICGEFCKAIKKKILPDLKPPIGCNNHNHECTCMYHQYSITPRLGLIGWPLWISKCAHLRILTTLYNAVV